MSNTIHTNTSYIKSVCEKALTIIASYESGTIGIVDASRVLAATCHELGLSRKEPFITFIAVESDTHHLPGSDQRVLWSQRGLAKVDMEISELEGHYRDEMIAAGSALCEQIKQFKLEDHVDA